MRPSESHRRWAIGLFLLTSCDTARDMLRTSGEIRRVEREVSTLLSHENVDAYLEDTREFLVVEIRNSPLANLSPDQKRSKALNVARLAYRTYASRTSLKSIEVILVIDRTDANGTRYYNAMDRFKFPVSVLG